MNTQDLPAGIRAHMLKSGELTLEARVNRSGVKMQKSFPTVKAANAWKSRMDSLIDSGVDPRELAENKRLKFAPQRGKEKEPAMAPVLSDTPVETNADLRVDEAVNAYLESRRVSANKLKPNQITEFERVRDDLGNLAVANLTNDRIEKYISALLTMPRKRDEPQWASERKERQAQRRKEKIAAAGVLPRPPTAKELANARYKEKLRAKKPLKVPKPLALATVRKYVIALETVLKWHAKNRGTVLNEFLFDFNSKVVPSAWSEPRERRLLQGEENLLYANGVDRGGYTYTEHDWRMVLGFTLETGMRRQEVTLAKWTDIKSEGYKLFIPKKNAKTKKDRMALLSRRAREIIEMQRATCPKGDERIFHQFPSSAALGSAFAALTTRAEVSGLTFHDLRHEATSRLCESGKLKLMEIMEMTGHDTMRTFRRYVKLIAHENDRRLD